MNVAGYEEDPLVDGTPFLDEPLFWATYLSALVAPTKDSLVATAFGVDLEDCYAYYERLTDPDAWPVFRLGLRNEHEIDVIFYNAPEDYGVNVVMCRPGGQHPMELAILGGHEFRPGLSWRELVTAARWSDAPYGVVEPNARLLLLMPAFGDMDLPDEATATVTDALLSCGAGAGADELAAYVLPKLAWGAHWRRHVDGALVNDGRYSRRNPQGPAAQSPVDLLEISSALAETA